MSKKKHQRQILVIGRINKLITCHLHIIILLFILKSSILCVSVLFLRSRCHTLLYIYKLATLLSHIFSEL